MKNTAIVEALRTPIARARKGSLVSKDAFDLAEAGSNPGRGLPAAG
jgi:hypothetical protein